MDARFSSHYDPTTDAHQTPDDEDGGDDWDMALEALRDRRAYAKKQGERMRDAGFDEEAIGRWEKSGPGEKERGWEDVQWKRKGEEREWDVGKVDLDDEAVAEDEVGKLKERRRKVVEGQDAWKRKGGRIVEGVEGCAWVVRASIRRLQTATVIGKLE